MIIAAANSNIGFMKLEPRGVDAAKIMSPAIKPTSRHTASGPLVMKPVNVPILLLFFKHSMMISMAREMRSISMITPDAPINAS